MTPEASLSEVARLIQLSVAPVFLLSGVGVLLGVLTSRLARIIDRSRIVEAAEGPNRDEEELRVLRLRARLISRAISLSTYCALLVASVIAALFLGAFVGVDLTVAIAVAFVAAMLALIVALLFFLREVQLAIRQMRRAFP